MKRLLLLAALCMTACSGSDGDAPCSAAGQCLPGFTCEVGVCVPCDATRCNESGLTGIGPRGGVVCGADEVCLFFPENSLTQTVDVQIALGGRNIVVGDLVRVSDVYSLEPKGTVLTSPAVLEVPISTTVDISRISIYMSDTEVGPWQRITGNTDEVTARGDVSKLNYVTAAFSP